MDWSTSESVNSDLKLQVIVKQEIDQVYSKVTKITDDALVKICDILDLSETYHNLAVLLDLEHLESCIFDGPSPSKNLLDYAINVS